MALPVPVFAAGVLETRVRLATGVELALWRSGGSGRGMLLVHGLASNARLWDATAAELSRLGHAVAAVDMRGHGRSERPDHGYDMDTVCADLAGVCRHLAGGAAAWQAPVVVGQSWGANVVLELAWMHPELVSGIACVDGGTIELSKRFPDWDECASVMAPPRLAGTSWQELEAMMRRLHPDWPDSGVVATLANFEERADGRAAPRLSLERHMAVLRGLWEHHPSKRYASIAAPVLLLPAETDGGDMATGKRRSVEKALATIPSAAAHWFSPSDHDIHAQHPVELARVLHRAVEDGFLAPREVLS